MVVKRSYFEKSTAIRYFPVAWQRQVDLVVLDEHGQTTVLRPVGSQEYSRIRRNRFPYAPAHGMGVTSGHR